MSINADLPKSRAALSHAEQIDPEEIQTGTTRPLRRGDRTVLPPAPRDYTVVLRRDPTAEPAVRLVTTITPLPELSGLLHNALEDICVCLLLSAARDGRHRDGHPLTRDALAAHLRASGYPVRNARLTPLLQALRGEAGNQPVTAH